MAVVTPCSHFFHANCLRKWLYVQDTCPLCHQQVTAAATEEDPSGGGAAAASRDTGTRDRGAATSPALAQLPGGDSAVPGQGDIGAPQDDGDPAHPGTPTPREPEAGTIPQPPRDCHPHSWDTQHPSPSPASPALGVGDSGDPHSAHPAS